MRRSFVNLNAACLDSLVEVVEQGKVQTPRVFYRREPDAQPLVVAKTRATK